MAGARHRKEQARPSGGHAEAASTPSPASPPLSPLPQRCQLVVAAVAFLVCLPTAWFGFVIWDDPVNVMRHPYLRPLTLQHLWLIWSEPYWDLYVPLVYTSYAIGGVLGGTDAWIHHLGNVLLHAGSTALVFSLVMRVVCNPFAAAAGALVFALHPLQAEAVAWVTGRKDVLAGFFSLLALLAHMRAREASARGRGGVVASHAGAAAFFLLALTAKPAAVTVPLMAVGFDLLVLRVGVRASLRVLWPWFLLAAAWTLVTSRAQAISFHVPLWLRPFVAGDAIMFYLRKILCPVGLSPIYDRTPFVLQQQFAWWLGLPLSLGLAVAVAWKGNRVARLGAVVFLAGLLPVLGLKSFRFQNYSTVADRYMYVSMLGVAVWAAWFLAWCAARGPRVRMAAGACAACAIAWLGVATVIQQRHWSTADTLVDRMLTTAPGNGAVHGLKVTLLIEKGLHDQALESARRSVQLLDRYDSHYNLGVAAMKKAQVSRPGERKPYLEEARAAFGKALSMQPEMAEALSGMGEVYMYMGNLRAAIESLQKAVRIAHTEARPRVNLGLCLAQLGRPDEAIEHYEIALGLKQDPVVFAYLAEALLQVGRRADAEAVAADGARFEPVHPEIVAVQKKLAAAPR